jgi:RNA polymerase sigma-70 factor (ECF subfamily)
VPHAVAAGDAEETAEALGIGVGAANSALFRAREAVEEKIGRRDPSTLAESGSVDEALLARYVRAFEESDAEAFVALLHEDIRTTMPPSPTWIAGRAANVAFYENLFTSGRAAALRITRTAANGQPAMAFYRSAGKGAPYRLHAIQVLSIFGGKITGIDHFMTREVFPAFGLPDQLA